MSETSPAIFLADGSLHEADSCVPLVGALTNGSIRGAAWSRGQYPGRRLPSDRLPGLRSVGCWDAEHDQDWFIPPHRNEGIELTAALAGEVPFETGGRQEILSRGRVALTSPWQQHSVGHPGIPASRLVYVILDVGVRRPNATWVWPEWFPAAPREMAGLARAILGNRAPVLVASAGMMLALDRVFELLMQSSPETDSLEMGLQIGLLLNALSKVLEERPKAVGADSPTHLAVRVYLEGLAGYLDHPWRLDEMARQCGLSKSRMTEVCRELTNRTPVEYLNEMRLDAALLALERDDGRSITQIALDCGFGSSQYFSRRFAARFGVTPRDCRARACAALNAAR